MLVVHEILGRRDEPRFAGRRVEPLRVDWDEAAKRRLRRETDSGTDVAIALPRGSYLSDGAVLDDDGRRIIVAERREERALVVSFDTGIPAQRLAEQALRLGHAFGNQHAPVEIDGAEVRVALTTSEEIARATVDGLGLDAVRTEVRSVALARDRPLGAGHDHHALAPGGHGAAASTLLGALQLGDSALPIGRFVHSHGVEAWLSAHQDAGEDELSALVKSALRESVAPLDGAVVALSHRATSWERLERLDELVTAHKLTPAARLASTACGRRLAALGAELTTSPLVRRLARSARDGSTDANLAVVEGALAKGLGIPERDAVLLELRGAAAGLLSAAVRLGRLSPTRAQVILLGLSPAIEKGTAEALAAGDDDLRSGAFELEIYALAHGREDARSFST